MATELERLDAALLDRLVAETRPACAEGVVASYIPALATVPRDRLAIAVHRADGVECAAGDADVPFSIQSVAKVFTLAYALDAYGEALWRRVGREPSGMRFNSMVQLESENGIPRNPLINAGALVTTDAMLARRVDWPDHFLAGLATLAGDAGTVEVDPAVYASERAHGDLNRAIAWFLKAKGNLIHAPKLVTEAYFRACSIAMSARALARAGRFLIGDGSESMPPAPADARFALPDLDLCRAPGRRRRVRAVMRTCGLYDAAGDFAYRVGLPAKSGVGGAILAVNPGRYSVAVWSPALDEKGNSAAGQRLLERLVETMERAA